MRENGISWLVVAGGELVGEQVGNDFEANRKPLQYKQKETKHVALENTLLEWQWQKDSGECL